MRRVLAALALVVLAAACSDPVDVATERAPFAPTTAAGSVPATAGPTTSAITGATTTLPTTTTTSTITSPTVTADTCPAVPPRRAPDPDRPAYDVTLTADPTTGVVEGSQDVRFVPDLPVDTLVLRLWANAPRPAAVGTQIVVGDVVERIGGLAPRTEVRAKSQPDPTTLIVELGRWVAPGEAVAVTVPWRLEVGGPVNDRTSLDGGALRLGSAFPLLAWEPGVGWAVEPPTSGFAEATTSPAADWTLRIAAPDGSGVVASGVEVRPGVWRADPARDVSVAVGRFTTIEATAAAPDPVQVTVSVHDGIDRAEDYLDQVVAELEAFATWYGPYPWPTYHLSITPGLSGGVEYPMHVLQGPGTGGRTTPHEVAHMWFYGLVGNSQARDPWLDEGLASYVEGRYLGTLDEMRGRSVPADGRGRAGEPMTYWEGRFGTYYRAVYTQTAAALSRLGDVTLVDCALAHYVATNAHGIARPEDLSRSLDATFASWRPTLAAVGLP